MPTFTYTPLTATRYRVSDAHTREVYGTVRHYADPAMAWGFLPVAGAHSHGYGYPTREAATDALYRTRTAFGFEAGAL